MQLYRSLCLVLSLTLTGSALSGQTQADKNAIERLIKLESDYFYQRQFSEWSDCYLHDEKVQWVCVETGDVVLEAFGWNYLGKFVGDYLTSNPEPIQITIERSNWQWRSLGKDAVWVTFDETQSNQAERRRFKGTRILERVGGAWKISGMFSYPLKS